MKNTKEGTIPIKQTEEYKKAVELINRANKEEEEANYTVCPKCNNRTVKSKWSGIACITARCEWFILQEGGLRYFIFMDNSSNKPCISDGGCKTEKSAWQSAYNNLKNQTK